MASTDVSGHPEAFYRNTLIYKRLTGTIFDLVDLRDMSPGNLCHFWIYG